jgi:hypothetical protein
VASVDWSWKAGAPPFGGELSKTPVWREYWPLRMLARDGQQSEVVTKKFVKVTRGAPGGV